MDGHGGCCDRLFCDEVPIKIMPTAMYRIKFRLWLKATVNSAFYGVCNWQSVAIRRDYTKMYFIQLAGKPLSKDCGFLLINFNDYQKLVSTFKLVTVCRFSRQPIS